MNIYFTYSIHDSAALTYGVVQRQLDRTTHFARICMRVQVPLKIHVMVYAFVTGSIVYICACLYVGVANKNACCTRFTRILHTFHTRVACLHLLSCCCTCTLISVHSAAAGD